MSEKNEMKTRRQIRLIETGEVQRRITERLKTLQKDAPTPMAVAVRHQKGDAEEAVTALLRLQLDSQLEPDELEIACEAAKKHLRDMYHSGIRLGMKRGMQMAGKAAKYEIKLASNRTPYRVDAGGQVAKNLPKRTQVDFVADAAGETESGGGFFSRLFGGGKRQAEAKA